MKNREYWKERFELLEQSQNQKGIQCYEDIEKQYRQAQRTLEGQISAWHQRFATNNGITLQEARKMLTSKELAELKWDINDYIRYGKENAINGAWTKQLENASARYHISRFEALKIQTQQSMEAMFGNQLDSLDTAMRGIYTNGYCRTAFEIQKGVGVGWDFATLDDKQISKIINKPWAADGKNFSERVWGNRQKLVNELNTTLTQNIILGQDPQKAIDEIARKMNTSKVNAGRLVMTEKAFFSSAAQKDCFTELDVEQYEIVATIDSRTSNICQEMDGKHFPMSQWEIGATVPPFHVCCRSTTCPFFGDEFDSVGERAARDPDGKTYYVPSDMTYKEWHKEYVEKSKEHVKIELTDTEQGSLNKYLSFDSYLINDSLRNGIPLTDVQQAIADGLDSALSKIPTYSGNLSRSLEFDTKAATMMFMSQFTVNEYISFPQYISTTSSATLYNADGQVQIFIKNAAKGHDIRMFNVAESEVLYEKDAKFRVLKVIQKDDKYNIMLEEK